MLAEGKETSIVVTHVEKAGQQWANIWAQVDELEAQKLEKLMSEVGKLPDIDLQPKEDELCLALSAEYQAW